MWQNLQETVDLVTFTEEILNGKLHFLCGVIEIYKSFSSTVYLFKVTNFFVTEEENS